MTKSDFQLINQRILSTEFILNKEFNITQNQNVALEGRTDIELLQNNTAIVVFTLSVYKNTPLEKVPFQIEVKSEGTFKWNPEVEENQLNNYLNFNAPSILLSYIRSVISMITAYAGIPNFMIPLINFYKSSTSKEND